MLMYFVCVCVCVVFRLAAIALLVLQSEEEAFWCLVAIVQFLMPMDYYTKTLLGSQVQNNNNNNIFIYFYRIFKKSYAC